MAAAPQYGFFIFKGLSSGKTYSLDAYFSDVSGANANVDGGNGAGSTSNTSWRPPEDVILTDFGIHTGMTDTTRLRLAVNGRPTSQVLRFAAQLDTSVARPIYQIGFKANSDFSAIQLA